MSFSAIHAPLTAPLKATQAAWVLVIFLLLSVMTNFRLTGFPLGLAEIPLLILVFSLFKQGHVIADLNRPLIGIWAIFFACLTAGYLVSGHAEHNTLALHNSLAFVYNAVFSILLFVYLRRSETFALGQFLLFFLYSIAVLYAFAALAVLTLTANWLEALNITTLYSNRLAAWSNNPNQLSLLFTALPIIWLFIVTKYPHLLTRGKYILIVLLFLLGLLQRSDGLVLAWASSLVFLFLASIFFRQGARSKETLILCALLLTGWGAMKALPSFIEAMDYHSSQKEIPFLSPEQERVGQKLVTQTPESDLFSSANLLNVPKEAMGGKLAIGLDPNKVGSRLELWRSGLEKWRGSPWFGHGPGAFAKLPAYDFEMEAHNLLIDLLTQVGILGCLPLIVGGLAIVWLAVRRRDPWPIALLLAVGAFSCAHFTFRMPVFWFYVIFAAYLATRPLTAEKVT